ncbi:uncharacterized protein FOKN1_2324 [Thiohalobacter thiocyanaticus]|uniref:Methanolan biosynthesis EpsI domain-containing protein n=1 Tax=Thiohalobacter thiocyanaticus TaxID=585455 RepID=A0A1Z4VTP0_9GAMM|nr:exosortase A [Thiohalobacter thiocyanaticus]BAZ94698.1 uncharacterized protein FOKN1_2324 [Thiohalobacter thiocyanaticus]
MQMQASGVQQQLLLFVVALLSLLAFYHQTLAGMIDIWSRSETFAHGFLIFPIVLFLVWRRREHLAVTPVAADARALWLLPLPGLLWLLAEVVDAAVIRQLGFIAMIPLLVWALLGWAVVRQIAFPLFFLIFAVPMGEGLIPPLMDFTAVFTVSLIKLSGIPVYVEGTYFSIPSGNWSVVEACSGIRYLIASLTMGALYAYLNYTSLRRRILFILFAIALPILANGLRAYMIVMIAHLSDMKLALGVDHFIYGWVFFGIVMLLMFWIGSFWREEPEPVPAPAGRAGAAAGGAPRYGLFALLILLLAAWPVAAQLLERDIGLERERIALTLPEAAAGWQRVEPFTDWQPDYRGMDAEALGFFAQGEASVGVYLAYYARPRQGAELINSQNVMIAQKHPVWHQVGESRVSVEGGPGRVIQTRLKSAAQRLLIHDWYRIGGHHTANPYLGKLLEAWERLRGNGRPSVGIVIFTEEDPAGSTDREALRRFQRDLLPRLEARIELAWQRSREGDG